MIFREIPSETHYMRDAMERIIMIERYKVEREGGCSESNSGELQRPGACIGLLLPVALKGDAEVCGLLLRLSFVAT